MPEEFRSVIARLTDSYDAACEERAERERHHTLYRLSELITQVEREASRQRMVAAVRGMRSHFYYQNLDTGSKHIDES